MTTLFNINEVRNRLQQFNPVIDAERVRTFFQEELFDWIDCYNETLKEQATSQEAIDARLSIINLWIEYGTFEKSLKQYKKASQVYEDAIKEPLSSTSYEIYIAYANYYTERDKPSSAKKTIIRGLCVRNMSMDDVDRLWLYFLNYMHDENKSLTLTIHQLHEAVKLQMTSNQSDLVPPSAKFIEKYGLTGQVRESPTQSTMSVDLVEAHSHAESKQENELEMPSSYLLPDHHVMHPPPEAQVDNNILSSASTIPYVEVYVPPPPMPEAAHAISNPVSYDMASELNALFHDDYDNIAGLSPEQLIQMHSERPPILFSAPDKEPVSWGLASLTAADIRDLEAFLGCPLAAISQPLSPYNTKANMYLDIIESLWMIQAMKERDFDAWFSTLKQTQTQAAASYIENLDVARATSVSELIVKAEANYQQHQNHALVQREVLHAFVNHSFHKLLVQQQQCLLSIGFPLFNADIVKKIDDAMIIAQSSASAISPYHRIQNLVDVIAHQSVLVCALLSIRLLPMMQSMYAQDENNDHSMMSSSDMMSHDVPDLRRMSSVESDRSGDWNQHRDKDDRNNKRRRRKRGGAKNRNRMTGAAGMNMNMNQASEGHSTMVLPMFTVPDISDIVMQQQAQYMSFS